MKQMKKMLSVFLAVLMALSMFTTAAYAVLPEEEEVLCISPEPEYFLTPWGLEMKDFIETFDFDELKDYLIEHFATCPEAKADILRFNIPVSKITEFCNVVWNNIPELFHMRCAMSYTYRTVDGVQIINTIGPSVENYAYSAEEYAERMAICKKAGDKLLYGIEGNDSLSELEKAILIHDRLDVYVEYAYAEYLAGTLSSTMPQVYNMDGVLVDRKAVCNGYALAYTYLARRVGLKSFYCSSDLLNHGWNIVYIAGVPYHLDATWDDPVWDKVGRAYHNSLLVSSNAFSAEPSGHNKNGVVDYDTTPSATTYDNAFWRSNVTTQIVYIDGYCYYIANGNDRLTAAIKKTPASTIADPSDDTVLFTIGETWKSGTNSYWGKCYSSLSSDGRDLYYNGTDRVYKYDIQTGTKSVFYTPSQVNASAFKYIYGSYYDGKYLTMDIADTANYEANASFAGRIKVEILTDDCIAGDHLWKVTQPAVPATCTSAGQTAEQTCMACGLENAASPVTQLPHTFTAATVKDEAKKSDATCTSPAVYYYSCADCGAVENNNAHTFTNGTAIAHNYTAATVKAAAKKSDATCTSAAVYYYSCADCGAVENNDLHTFTNGTTISHTYTAATVKAAAKKSDATCTSAAVYYYSCAACGAVENNDSHTFTNGTTIAHSYTAATVKAAAKKSDATCTSAAVYYYSCAACGAVENNDAHTFTNGTTIAHSYTAATVKAEAKKSDATCTASAVYYYSCAACGAVENNDSHTFTNGAPIAHTYTAETVKGAAKKSDATCISAAIYYYSCAACGAVENNDAHTFTNGDALAHTYTAKTVKAETKKADATCTAAAVYYYSCATCGAVENNDAHTFTNGTAIAHTYTAKSVKAEAKKADATCTSAAVYYYSCAACGAVENNDAHTFTNGDALAHTYTAATVKAEAKKSDATCSSAAVYYYSCSECGAVENNDAHTFTSGTTADHSYKWVIDVPATCTTDGKKHEKCTNCDAVRNENTVIVANGEHAYTAKTVKAEAEKSGATCTSAAVYYYSCAVCGAVENNDAHTFTSGDALAHVGEWRVKTQPTCGKDGVKEYICKNCNTALGQTQAIASTGEHTPVTVAGKAPTCTEAGSSEYTKCSVCNKQLSDSETTPALGHSFEDGKCTRCGNECSHICHSTSGFGKFIFKILAFFWHLFKMNPVCTCGNPHY